MFLGSFTLVILMFLGSFALVILMFLGSFALVILMFVYLFYVFDCVVFSSYMSTEGSLLCLLR